MHKKLNVVLRFFIGFLLQRKVLLNDEYMYNKNKCNKVLIYNYSTKREIYDYVYCINISK